MNDQVCLLAGFASMHGTPAVLPTSERVAPAKPELPVRQRVPVHPCQFSPEVIAALEELVPPGEHVHDPFAGCGFRLAALCDRIGAVYTGTDIEDWPDRDPRVPVGDSTLAQTYPDGAFIVVTSPVYLKKRLADYANGPKPTTKTNGRRDYGISLGRALEPGNLARYTGRPGRACDYWRLHSEAVRHWGHRALVNVDAPISKGWCEVLEAHGYEVVAVTPVRTRRYGGLHNADQRADHEVLIEARRAP
jgi:hypothetical protein